VTVEKEGRKVEELRLYSNPTIGEIRSLRNKGAIILFQIMERFGNQVDRTWITGSGVPVCVHTTYLQEEL